MDGHVKVGGEVRFLTDLLLLSFARGHKERNEVVKPTTFMRRPVPDFGR